MEYINILLIYLIEIILSVINHEDEKLKRNESHYTSRRS